MPKRRKRQRYTIPGDWDGDSWFCVRLYWPASPQWIALLVGHLSQMERGWSWDEKSGDLLAVLEIGQQIYERNMAFVPCGGAEPSPGQEPEVIYKHLLVEAELGECNMSNCSIPYGALARASDGVLYYRYCGAWYPVGALPDGAVIEGGVPDGGSPYDVPPTQPGDLPDGGSWPEDYAEGTACSKATAIMDVVHGIVDEIFDAQNAGIVVPTSIINEVRARYPTINFGAAALMNAIAAAANIQLAGEDDQSNDETFKQRMLCAVEKRISDGNEGLTKDERAAVQDAIAAEARAEFDIVTHALTSGSWPTLYIYAYRAIGASDTTAITSYRVPVGNENCECPGEVLGGWSEDTGYNGPLRFGNLYDKSGDGDFIASLFDNGRVCRITWGVAAGDNRTYFARLDTDDVGNTITSCKIRVFPDAGPGVPPRDFTDCGHPTNPFYWHYPEPGPSADWQAPSRSPTLDFLEIFYNAEDPSPKTLAFFELNTRNCPQNDSPLRYWSWVYEIVEVNGVAYG